MWLLGISSDYHDSAAALILDGVPVAAAQEERFTRIKHDKSFPEHALRFCLKKAGLKLSDLEACVFYEKPLLKLDRVIDSYFEQNSGLAHFVSTAMDGVVTKLTFKQRLYSSLRQVDPKFALEKLLFSEHHLSHAASAFFPSPFSRATVITMDGVGEKATTSVGVGKGRELKIIKEIHYPNSLGLFYSTLTTFCGFKVNSGEYKLMGLAPYGQPRFAKALLEQVIELRGDGSYRLNDEHFNFHSQERMYTSSLSRIFAVAPRAPESELTQIYLDIAASAQHVLNEAVSGLVQAAIGETGISEVCLAGGVALNCVSNAHILTKTNVSQLWIQPAAGDAGGSLGAALSAYHLHFKQERTVQPSDSMRGCYLGPSYEDDYIEQILLEHKLSYRKLAQTELVHTTAQLLAGGAAIGWFQGAMEFGPRALGARSILADARDPEMQRRLNLKIKFRESFRPFAPVVLEEKAAKWFAGLHGPSAYMLVTYPVADKFPIPEEMQNAEPLIKLMYPRSAVPAVTHLDYSARVQTLSATVNPLLHALLTRFDELTGVPMLVNTSFNVRGEPIVESPSDALRCFSATDIDYLVLGSYLIAKTANPHLERSTYAQNLPQD